MFTVQSVQIPAVWNSCTASVNALDLPRSKDPLMPTLGLDGPHRERGDDQPSTTRYGLAEKRPVPEGPRLTLGAVDDQVAARPGLSGDPAHLRPWSGSPLRRCPGPQPDSVMAPRRRGPSRMAV